MLQYQPDNFIRRTHAANSKRKVQMPDFEHVLQTRCQADAMQGPNTIPISDSPNQKYMPLHLKQLETTWNNLKQFETTWKKHEKTWNSLNNMKPFEPTHFCQHVQLAIESRWDKPSYNVATSGGAPG